MFAVMNVPLVNAGSTSGDADDVNGSAAIARGIIGLASNSTTVADADMSGMIHPIDYDYVWCGDMTLRFDGELYYRVTMRTERSGRYSMFLPSSDPVTVSLYMSNSIGINAHRFLMLVVDRGSLSASVTGPLDAATILNILAGFIQRNGDDPAGRFNGSEPLKDYYRSHFPRYVSLFFGYAAGFASPQLPWKVSYEDARDDYPVLADLVPEEQVIWTLEQRDEPSKTRAPVFQLRVSPVWTMN